jgi:N-acetylmuramoyl-L-alanine amidase
VTGRLQIPRHAVVAHGDIAPTRKRDPGVQFPWQQLARRASACGRARRQPPRRPVSIRGWRCAWSATT